MGVQTEHLLATGLQPSRKPSDSQAEHLITPIEPRRRSAALLIRHFRQEGKGDGVYAVAFSPDGKFLAGSGRGTLWEIATGKAQPFPADQPFEMASLAFSPDGATLAVASRSAGLTLWSVATGERKGDPPFPGKDGPRVAGVAFTPKGGILACQRLDTEVWMWDVEASKLL